MTDDHLDRALEALDRLPSPVTWSEVEARAGGAPDDADPGGPGPRRGRRVLVALAAAAVLVVALVVAWPDAADEGIQTGPGPDPGPTTSAPPDPTAPRVSTPPPTAPPTQSTTPAGGTSRLFPVTAVTDTDYLVWGGEVGTSEDLDAGRFTDVVRADGFAVDLATGTTRPIPTAPVGPAEYASGVWDGTELVVCCGSPSSDAARGARAAAWDPATGDWRALADPPASVADVATLAVWTGEQVVVVARDGNTGRPPEEGPAATYDPARDEWNEVPAPPVVPAIGSALLWTGDDVVIWDARYGLAPVPGDGAVVDRGWRWTPGDGAWTPLPDLPEAARTELGTAVWTGDEVVVWGQSTTDQRLGVGARWRPGDDRWRPLSPSPQGQIDWFEGTPGSQVVLADPDRTRVLITVLQRGDVAEAAPTYAYDPGTDSWSTTELAPPAWRPGATIAAGKLFVPDAANPIGGDVPG